MFNIIRVILILEIEDFMKITYVTGNKYKIFLAKSVFEPLGVEIDAKKIDCPEIQADSIEEVAKYSSKYASDYLKTDVLKNDSGLVIPALKGFPSAYTKYAEETIGEDGVLKLMEGIENREAYFIEALAYTCYGKDPVVFVSKTEGTIAKEKAGTNGWGWDYIFIPKGQTKTFACFDENQRTKFWDNKAYLELYDYLKKEK
jgi:XTP/dITP diphosphohydrolase